VKRRVYSPLPCWSGPVTGGTRIVMADSPELAAAKRLLDLARDQEFVF
jgi:regulator of extracellular matrix RemA (YlzA/DUF370 family)